MWSYGGPPQRWRGAAAGAVASREAGWWAISRARAAFLRACASSSKLSSRSPRRAPFETQLGVWSQYINNYSTPRVHHLDDAPRLSLRRSLMPAPARELLAFETRSWTRPLTVGNSYRGVPRPRTDDQGHLRGRFAVLHRPRGAILDPCPCTPRQHAKSARRRRRDPGYRS